MRNNELIPTSLKVVAALFMLTGATSLIAILLALMNGRIDIEFGALGLPIGWGLLHFSPGWRTLALVFLVLGIVGLPLIGLLFLTTQGPVGFSILSLPMGQVSKEVGLGFAAVAWVVSVWQFRVLTSDDVRLLFEGEKPR
ncbi:MAG: hypothetical protein QOJ81_1390 [Chloroflexota bacterium]|jgi:L-lactate permease|nr:hypothetical protein [Chloroflexota bacterium]